MYAALWRILPGPAWLRVLVLVAAAAVVVYGLFTFVFPWVSTLLNPDEISVQ